MTRNPQNNEIWYNFFLTLCLNFMFSVSPWEFLLQFVTLFTQADSDDIGLEEEDLI